MSPNISSFVGDLVAMAQAVEELPKVQQLYEEAQASNEKLSQTIGEREESILRLKAEVEQHLATIRALEVARDDAELRFLEADERTERALGFIKAQFGAAGGLIQALEPVVVPEPVAVQPEATVLTEAHAVTEPGQGEHPLAVSSEQFASYTQSSSVTPQTVPSTSPEHGEGQSTGQSEVDPTQASAHVDTGTQTANPTEVTASMEPKPSGPYSGKVYYNHPIYVSRQDWLAGGGSEADYDWRPSATAPYHLA